MGNRHNWQLPRHKWTEEMRMLELAGLRSSQHPDKGVAIIKHFTGESNNQVCTRCSMSMQHAMEWNMPRCAETGYEHRYTAFVRNTQLKSGKADPNKRHKRIDWNEVRGYWVRPEGLKGRRSKEDRLNDW